MSNREEPGLTVEARVPWYETVFHRVVIRRSVTRWQAYGSSALFRATVTFLGLCTLVPLGTCVWYFAGEGDVRPLVLLPPVMLYILGIWALYVFPGRRLGVHKERWELECVKSWLGIPFSRKTVDFSRIRLVKAIVLVQECISYTGLSLKGMGWATLLFPVAGYHVATLVLEKTVSYRPAHALMLADQDGRVWVPLIAADGETCRHAADDLRVLLSECQGNANKHVERGDPAASSL